MTNTNRKTRFVNLLIATVAAVVIMLTCMVPHAFAMAGGAEYEAARAAAGRTGRHRMPTRAPGIGRHRSNPANGGS